MHAWYAIRTKARQEDRVADNLSAWGVQALSPRLMSGQSSLQFQPLFPGYIFAHFDAATMLYRIHFTRGVAYVVSFGGKPAQLMDEIIASIRMHMDEGGVVRRKAIFQPGDEVVLISGPFRDFRGICERELPASERVRVLLSTVAYSIELSNSEVMRFVPDHGESGVQTSKGVR